MFTTIAKLRNSHAMTARVSSVENWLKKQNPNWTPDTKFPIFAIANSNAVDDVDWVIGTTSTHVAWPEMEKAILAIFGHANVAEHFDYIENQMRAHAGKTKAAQDLTHKYNQALVETKNFGKVLWPLTVANDTPVDAVKTEPAPTTETAQVEVKTESKAEPDVAPAPAEKDEAGMYTFAVLGAMYVAVGKVVMEKQKTFEDAVRYSLSPTGGRLFTQHVEAFGNGADVKEVRACLKTFASNMAD